MAGWSDAARDKRIGTAIDSALAPHIRNADQALARIIGIERQRLRTLLADFLDAEELRPSFSVAGVEQIAEYRKHGVALRFRIDRIDQLDDGGLIIIDYKTGRPKNFVRQDGDLREVQLVAYASALDGEIAGLVYINVDSREISYRGTGGGWRETSDDDWVDTLASWRALVDDALSELAGGDARIDSNQSAADGRVFGPLSRLEAYRRGR